MFSMEKKNVSKKKKVVKKKDEDVNKIFNKVNITYLVILLCDIALVIYCARFNKINYARVLDKEIFVGKTSNYIFGRNYINIIITVFVYFYVVIMNKFFLGRKNTKRFMIASFLLIAFINLLLFIIFSKRVY